MAESIVVNSIIFTYVELNYDRWSKGVEINSIIWNTMVAQVEGVLMWVFQTNYINNQ